MTKRIDDLIILSLCVLIFGLPFSNSIIETAATAAIALWFFKKIAITHIIRVEDTPLNTPISLYFLFVMLSLFNSKFLVTSLTGFGFKAMEHFLVFVVIIDTVRSGKDFRKIMAAILLSCALMAADGLWQYFMHYDFLRQYPIWSSFNRLTASFKFPNGFGVWLATLIPLSVALAIFNIKERWYRIAGIILAVLLAICFILNFTKGAWVAILPALAFIIWKRGDVAKKILLAILLALVSGVIILTFAGGNELFSSYVARGQSAIYRLDLIKMCWKMFLDHPLLGHGINTFMSIYENYSADITYGGVSYAHNCYMQIAVETGIFSLLAFLWMIAVLFTTSLKDISQKNDGLIKTAQIGILAGLLAYLVQAAVETSLYSLALAILFYYFLGLAMVLQKIRD